MDISSMTPDEKLGQAAKDIEALAQTYELDGMYVLTHAKSKKIKSNTLANRSTDIKINVSTIGDYVQDQAFICNRGMNIIYTIMMKADILIQSLTNGNKDQILQLMESLDEIYGENFDETLDGFNTTITAVGEAYTKATGNTDIIGKITPRSLNKIKQIHNAFTGNYFTSTK